MPVSGAVAGIFGRTDTTRGVWKAPAGVEAGVRGAVGPARLLSDGENGVLNSKGINCLMVKPNRGLTVWGSRTTVGFDGSGNQWKYVPVRRLFDFVEETLFRNTLWVVFEINDAPLWRQIRLDIKAFMNTLFRQGAFQGASAAEAYYVACGWETMTQADIDNGIINIEVGFAPVKPAEFVVISFRQKINTAGLA
jgi:phage tail sheath protein FI